MSRELFQIVVPMLTSGEQHHKDPCMAEVQAALKLHELHKLEVSQSG